MIWVAAQFADVRGWATKRPDAAFAWLHRAHWVLLLISLFTIFVAVAGSHGWSSL